MRNSFYRKMLSAIERKEKFALALLSKTRGSTPQKAGAKALFYLDGRIEGTLGGGCLEAEVRERARHSLLNETPEKFELILDHDFGWDDGLICGGKVEGVIIPAPGKALPIWEKFAAAEFRKGWGVSDSFEVKWLEAGNGNWLYQERPLMETHLWIAGSGHIAKELAPLAVKLEFKVSLFDDRPALANYQSYPEEVELRIGDWKELLQDAPKEKSTMGVIVTRGHQHDALVLSKWINYPFSWLGMIGSKRKKRIIFEGLVEENIASREQLEKVSCPVGIDIQAVTVPEIALSIAAELIKQRAKIIELQEAVA